MDFLFFSVVAVERLLSSVSMPPVMLLRERGLLLNAVGQSFYCYYYYHYYYFRYIVIIITATWNTCVSSEHG